jgi:hypothetical protein
MNLQDILNFPLLYLNREFYAIRALSLSAWVRGEISAIFPALIERRSRRRKLTTIKSFIKSFKGHPDESGSNI